MLVEAEEDEDFECTGRAAHQAPEVDGECVLERGVRAARSAIWCAAVVVGTEGIDLVVDAARGAARSDLEAAPAGALPRRAPRGSRAELCTRRRRRRC